MVFGKVKFYEQFLSQSQMNDKINGKNEWDILVCINYEVIIPSAGLPIQTCQDEKQMIGEAN